MNKYISYKKRNRNIKCRCCGSMIKSNSKEVLSFLSEAADRSMIALCDDCIVYMFDISYKRENGND